MGATDGRYLKLADFKMYAINGATVLNTADDLVLTSSILRAEAEIDGTTKTAFDEQTHTLVRPMTAFVDYHGWLHLFSRERAPVTAVAAIQTRDLLQDKGWVTTTWDTDDLILPVAMDPPRPDSWHVMVLPSNNVPTRATTEMLVRWTYTGGYATIPPSLQALTMRLAWWVYKLREAPLAKIVTAELGLMQIPLSIPPDIRADLRHWSPMYS